MSVPTELDHQCISSDRVILSGNNITLSQASIYCKEFVIPTNVVSISIRGDVNVVCDKYSLQGTRTSMLTIRKADTVSGPYNFNISFKKSQAGKGQTQNQNLSVAGASSGLNVSLLKRR